MFLITRHEHITLKPNFRDVVLSRFEVKPNFTEFCHVSEKEAIPNFLVNLI